MSATSIALLLTTAATGAVGVAVLRSVLVLRRQVAALHTALAESRAAELRGRVPAARTTADADEIRAAVAEALAEERERELAEARAFWAAQESRGTSDAPLLLGFSDSGLSDSGLSDSVLSDSALSDGGGFDGGFDGGLSDGEPFLPHPADLAGLESPAGAEAEEPPAESAELAAARRRHPSHPDFVPNPSPAGNDHERTVTALEELAAGRVELADVRPGPLGTLDVYVFADGTTLCMTPGHRETSERLASALRAGETPVLLGGSGVSGAYALTFSCGEESVYVLADRVIASL
ncbi:hypothetical protein [Streptomyces sp. CRN 30]|uniref:hypothetical protein n=1 Tax=Streptomyces sp. CRN 30 TaxID=3075613 RepID=UPI002A7EDEAD|nr:hypothetical protein [Streptomyces sp. CRN 30]